MWSADSCRRPMADAVAHDAAGAHIPRSYDPSDPQI